MDFFKLLVAEVVRYVECVMTFSSPPVKFNKSLTQVLNYEGRAMAYIIFVLKLLLGLDGKTEYEISKVSKKLNK
jgi:TATA box-binding protein-associated factor RNA polymerase I subunit B